MSSTWTLRPSLSERLEVQSSVQGIEQVAGIDAGSQLPNIPQTAVPSTGEAMAIRRRGCAGRCWR